MAPGSSITNISSVLGLTTAGLPQAAYSASKAGLIGLTRDLAQQWTGRKGIRVNALAPGFFESEMTDQYPEGYIEDRKSTRLNSSHANISYAVFCLKKKKTDLNETEVQLE